MKKVISGIMVLSMLTVAAAFAGQEIVPTPLFMDVYGFAKTLGPGDVVTAVDSNGVICGRFTVKKAGQYGFVHVYGDDPASVKDEGAVAGERVKIMVNGDPKAAVDWTADSKKRIDF